MLGTLLTGILGQPLPVRAMQRVMDPYALRVVCYHSVADRHPFLPQHLYVTPDCLRRHIEGLSRVFRIVPLADIARIRQREIRFPLVITFDDGLADGFEAALPILRACGVRATFFLNALPYEEPQGQLWTHQIYMLHRRVGTRRLAAALTTGCKQCRITSLGDIIHCLRVHSSYPDLRARLDRLASEHNDVLKEGPTYLDQSMVRCLVAQGMEIGSHGYTHFDLTRCENLKQECEQAKAVLERVAGIAVSSFAYPFGDEESLSGHTHAHLRREFDLLCTTAPRVNVASKLGVGIIDRVCAYELPVSKLILKLLHGI